MFKNGNENLFFYQRYGLFIGEGGDGGAGQGGGGDAGAGTGAGTGTQTGTQNAPGVSTTPSSLFAAIKQAGANTVEGGQPNTQQGQSQQQTQTQTQGQQQQQGQQTDPNAQNQQQGQQTQTGQQQAPTISPEVTALFRKHGSEKAAQFSLETGTPFFDGRASGAEFIDKVFNLDKNLAARIVYAAIDRFGKNTNVIEHWIAKHPEVVARFTQNQNAQGNVNGAPGTTQTQAQGVAQTNAGTGSALDADTVSQLNAITAQLGNDHPVTKLLNGLAAVASDKDKRYSDLAQEIKQMREEQTGNSQSIIQARVEEGVDNIILGQINELVQLGDNKPLQEELITNISAKIQRDPIAMEMYERVLDYEFKRSTWLADQERERLADRIKTHTNTAVSVLAGPLVKQNTQLHQTLTHNRSRQEPSGTVSSGQPQQPAQIGSLLAHVKANPISGRR
jgi:hypothetical protein